MTGKIYFFQKCVAFPPCLLGMRTSSSEGVVNVHAHETLEITQFSYLAGYLRFVQSRNLSGRIVACMTMLCKRRANKYPLSSTTFQEVSTVYFLLVVPRMVYPTINIQLPINVLVS